LQKHKPFRLQQHKQSPRQPLRSYSLRGFRDSCKSFRILSKIW